MSFRGTQYLKPLLVLLALMTSPAAFGATGDITSLTVRADGHSADLVVEGFTTGATYAFGLGTNNAVVANAKLSLTATSLGYDTAGNPTTVARTIYGTKQLRKAHPNDASADEAGGGNLTVRIGLSEPVYAKDESGGGNSGTDVTATILSGLVVNTGGAAQSSAARSGFTVTNNSTLAYPKVIGRWAWPGFERWTGDTLVEAVCFSPFGQNGKPVACVQFDCSDGTNSAAQQVVTAMTKTTRTGDANVVSVYAATIPVTALTQGGTLTARFRAYPWVGDSGSILDTDTTADGIAAPAAPLTPLMGHLDKSDLLACYVSVDGVGAGTPTVQATAALARTTPYATVASALTALKAFNNSIHSDNSLNCCYMLMQNGSYTCTGTFTGSNLKSWLTIQADIANGATQAGVNFATATNTAFNGYVRFKNVTFSGTGAGMLRGNVTTGQLWLDNCTWSHAATAQWYSWKCAYATQNVFTTGTQNLKGSGSGLVSWPLIRGNDLTAITAKTGHAYCLIGNKNVLPFPCELGVVATEGPQSDGGVIAWNSVYSVASSVSFFGSAYDEESWTKGTAIVGNVAERITSSTTPLVQVCADNNLGVVANNFLFAHNTFIGARTNVNYLEVGNYHGTRDNWFDYYNIYEDYNQKSDVFQNAVRTVTDGIITNGSTTVTSATAAFVAGDVAQNISFEQVANGITTISSQAGTTAVMAAAANADATGVTLYIRNFGKNSQRVTNWAYLYGCGCRGSRYVTSIFIRDFTGIDVAVGAVTFNSNKSFSGTGAGGGDYTLPAASVARNCVPAGKALIPFDLTGAAIGNNGNGHAGAIQGNRRRRVLTFNLPFNKVLTCSF